MPRSSPITAGNVPTEHPLPIHAMPGHLIRRLHQVSASVFAEKMAAKSSDLTPVQYAALSAIAAYPGIDQVSLANIIAYDRATIGGVIDRLENKKLVRRTTSPHDRRLRLLVIEPAGRKHLARISSTVERVQDRILAPLGASDRAEFMKLLNKLVRANNDISRAPMRPAVKRRNVVDSQTRRRS